MDSGPDYSDRPLAGIAIMIAGIAAFAVMDATIKWLTAAYPVPQVIALRSWSLAFFIAPISGCKSSGAIKVSSWGPMSSLEDSCPASPAAPKGRR